MFGLSSPATNEKHEKSTLRIANKGVLSCRKARIGTPVPRGIAARTATFRLRVARSGDEVRQLAVWQPRLRVPQAAQAAVPEGPWPVRGASWIRDNTPGRTSRAGTGKPR